MWNVNHLLDYFSVCVCQGLQFSTLNRSVIISFVVQNILPG